MDKSKLNASNERMKYKYRHHIQRTKGMDIKTVIENMKHIRLLEKFMQFTGFQNFNRDVACKYVSDLCNKAKSMSFITSNLRAIKDFLNWLERQRGYRSKINYDDIDYLNVSRNQRRAAKAQNYQKTYKYSEIIQTIRQMPDKTEKDLRDRAMVSLQALCTLRISELRTVKIRNMIEEDGILFIDVNPKNMSVKFAKQREAVFIPLPDDIIENVVVWRAYSGIGTTSVPVTSAPRHITRVCSTSFEIDPNGIISHVSFTGNDCKAETPAPKQTDLGPVREKVKPVNGRCLRPVQADEPSIVECSLPRNDTPLITSESECKRRKGTIEDCL